MLLWIVPVIGYPHGAESLSKQNDIRIVQSEGTGLLVEYVPRYGQPAKVRVGGREFDRYEFEGEVPLPRGTAGAPRLMMRSVPLRFPGAAGNSVELLTVEYEEIGNVDLLPVPDARESDVGPVLTYEPKSTEYSVADFVPSSVVSLDGVGETRGVILGELRIMPIQYNPARHTIRKYSRVVVRVRFGNSEPTTRQPDDLVHGIALNDESSMITKEETARLRPSAIRNSVLSSGEWFRFGITEDGMYKVSGSTLLSAGVPASTDLHNIRIFGNGGYELPMSVNAPYADDLIENAVYVFDNGSNNQLEAGDYLIFYGKSPRGWNYTPASKSFAHYINHFTETSSYWLTFGNTPAKAMTAVPSENTSSPYHPGTVVGMLFREDEKVNLLSSGQEWLGQSFNSGQQLAYVHPLFALDESQPVSYRFNLGSKATGTSSFQVSEHGSVIASAALRGVSIGSYYDSQCVRSVAPASLLPSFSDDQSQLRFSYSSPSGGAGYIDWYEIVYHQFPVAQNDVVYFRAHDTTAVAEYSVSGLSGGQTYVFDVTRFDSVLLITNPRTSSDSCVFQVQLNAGSAREFYVVGPNGFKSAGLLSRVVNQNLHGDTTESPSIIITHSEFMQAALRLKAHREQPGINYLKTLVVDVDQVYNEFSGGAPSPIAIRNYLRYVYSNWTTPPKYVLLFGDGDYDYKRIVATGPNWIPAWETVESFFPLGSYATDDDFVIFNSGNRVALGIGRLTVRSLGEAQAMVDKIIEYESSSVRDPWKIRSTFVADDGLAGAGEPSNGSLHTLQAEAIAALTPPLFEKRKIYEFEYPTVYTSGGRRKPDVNVAIVSQINQGTLTLNFTGHGNPRLWTHEHVFTVESDFPLLRNQGRYFFLVAATCNFSAFDVLGEQSGGEILAAMPNAGAIAVLSATRAVFAGDNFELNKTVYQKLFQFDGNGRLLPQRFGDLIYRTKQVHFSGLYNNDRKFFLLGDPATRVGFPQLFASVDSIEHQPGNQIVQMRALSNPALTATIRDTGLTPNTTYNGTAQIIVYDADRSVRLTDPDAGGMTYKASGDIIFRGDVSVRNGSVGTNFIVPKDISYTNDFGRITLYAWNETADAAGFTTNIRIGGTDSTAVADTVGPRIQLYVDRRTFRPGDVVSTTPMLIADLHDEHGVNTSGAGIGHRIEAWLDENPQSMDLTPYYKSKIDTYQDGEVEYSFAELSPGTHRLKLRAWDTYNNSSMGETVFDVATSIGLKISNVYNYPNPFSNGTVFTLEHNQISLVDVEVKIFTVAGRQIQSLKISGVNDRFVQVPWDGRDKDGDPLANGVYLYKVVLRTEDGRFASESYGKLSVLK